MLRDDGLGRVSDPDGDEPAAEENPDGDAANGAPARRVQGRHQLRVSVQPELLARVLGCTTRALSERELRLVLLGRVRWIAAAGREPAPSVLRVSWTPLRASAVGVDAANGDDPTGAAADVAVEEGTRALVALTAPWRLQGCQDGAPCTRAYQLDVAWFHGLEGHLEIEWFLLADLAASPRRSAAPQSERSDRSSTNASRASAPSTQRLLGFPELSVVHERARAREDDAAGVETSRAPTDEDAAAAGSRSDPAGEVE